MIAVISCVWQRPERLAYTLSQLGRQTYTDFVLVLINNNPALRDFVDEATYRRESDFPIVLHHNPVNRGPYARLEAMVALRQQYEWFCIVDDDANFGETWLHDMWRQRDANALQGWMGFRFKPGESYWNRTAVEPGQTCHYVFTSGSCVPRAAVDNGLLDLPERYRICCDDLWLSYYANHVKGMVLRRIATDMEIHVDNKDTYVHHTGTKVRLLNELRGRGWKV